MHPDKSNRFAGYKLMLSAVLLLACILLAVGVTLARYQTDKVSYMNYAVKPLGSISLQADGGWYFSGDSGGLSFSISNSEDGVAYAAEDQSVSVRLLASLSLEEIEGDQVQLYVSDGVNTRMCTAVSLAIEEGTALYQTFGAGRVYLFRNETGKEMSWTLAGGTLSVLSAELSIIGLEKPENPALLQLQVVGG